jgi:hypothetical protein
MTLYNTNRSQDESKKFSIKYLFIKRDKGLTYGVKHHFQQYFSYIVAVSFIGEGNQRSRTKPPTCKEINASLLKKTQIIILIKIRLTI